ncbi:DNA polymerase III subunit delta' [Bacillus sp. 165]|uniref:DNA polymerase III subunit delta' n=1 Tax=Bacillus sp. 165 TaxID=1529117 RepID=UPI001ADA19C6|nr:DNA polymerase III subunit delta' [Bacillus sp. 165]MBO9131281.1 DNA polymerase III subunit delta' [Bacillus sp. 165]
MSKTWEQLHLMQPIAVKMLINSIAKKRVSHAYLFEGPKGTGKLATAMQLTKRIFCSNPSGHEPCQQCHNCRRIESGNHPNIYVVKPDGLSIKKQQIQQLQEEFSKTGLESNQKVYILEHADRMTVTAANTLLKFLEEPNSQTTAVLLTEQSHQILNTILSRCQIVTFRPLPKEMLIESLKEQEINLTLALLAAQLTNNWEEALQLCKEEWFAQARVLVIKLYKALAKEDPSLFFVQEKWVKHFSEKEQMQLGLDMLLLIYKDLLYVQISEEENVVFKDQIESLKQHSLQYSQKRIVSSLSNILEAKQKINANVSLQLVFEQLVLRLQEG